MRLKAVVLSSYNLISGWVVKHKYSNCQWTWTPWLDPHEPFMQNSWDFHQGMGGGIVSVIIVCRQCGPRSCSTDPNCLKLWRYFWFFYILVEKNQGPELQCLRKVKEDLSKAITFQHAYTKCLINSLYQCSTCGQRYHCDLQKKWNYFDLNQFETFFFSQPAKSICD